MESQYQKWVNLSYLALAALVGYIVFSLSFKAVGAWDLEARVRNVELIVRVGSVVAGGLLFFILWKNQKSNTFMNEVMSELARVTFPTPKETMNATVVVIIMVIISGLILGLFDYLCTTLLKWIV
jgi:preprotein translocase SecE subunit